MRAYAKDIAQEYATLTNTSVFQKVSTPFLIKVAERLDQQEDADKPEDLYVEMFVDADFCGDEEDCYSTSGGWIQLTGPSSQFPVAGISKKQSTVARSTTEAEAVALNFVLLKEGVPLLELFKVLLGKETKLKVREDNEATAKVVTAGYSKKLRYLHRTQRISLASSLADELNKPGLELALVRITEQKADVFTKALSRGLWQNAIHVLDNADFADFASDCVSSDHGGDSNADTTTQKDLVVKLLKQLHDQKKSMQDLKAEHAGTNAEQIEQLMLQLSENNLTSEKMAAEHEILKKLERSNRLDHIKKMDALQRMMRTMQGQLDDQDIVMKEQTRTAEVSEQNQTNLEEQLQLQTEALRITSLRLQDALQQHENDSIRHQQEQSSLKLQLAVERKKTGTYAHEEPGEEPELSPEEILERRVQDLQEERCILLGKLEFRDVQFQLQLEEMQREHANKLQEQQRFFAEQIVQLRSAGGSQISNLVSSGGLPGEWTPTSHSLPDREGSGSSQAMASAISGTASSPNAPSDCGGTDASGSGSQPLRHLVGVKGLIWSILCTLPSVAALMCLTEGVLVQNMTQRAGILLGSNLIGKSIYTLVKEQNVMSLQRTIMATMPPTDAASEPSAEDLTRTLARVLVCSPSDCIGNSCPALPAQMVIARAFQGH
eukprot:s2775_g1.t2